LGVKGTLVEVENLEEQLDDVNQQVLVFICRIVDLYPCGEQLQLQRQEVDVLLVLVELAYYLPSQDDAQFRDSAGNRLIHFI